MVVTMHHSRFEPSVVEVELGERVRFVLRNTDPIDHEFILGDDAVQRRHEQGQERQHHGDVPGAVGRGRRGGDHPHLPGRPRRPGAAPPSPSRRYAYEHAPARVSGG